MKKRVKMSIINLGVFALASAPFIHASQNVSQNICPEKIPADIIMKHPEQRKMLGFRTVCVLREPENVDFLLDRTVDHFLLSAGRPLLRTERSLLKAKRPLNSPEEDPRVQYYLCGYHAMHTSHPSKEEIDKARNQNKWIALECKQKMTAIKEYNPSGKVSEEGTSREQQSGQAHADPVLRAIQKECKEPTGHVLANIKTSKKIDEQEKDILTKKVEALRNYYKTKEEQYSEVPDPSLQVPLAKELQERCRKDVGDIWQELMKKEGESRKQAWVIVKKPTAMKSN